MELPEIAGAILHPVKRAPKLFGPLDLYPGATSARHPLRGRVKRRIAVQGHDDLRRREHVTLAAVLDRHERYGALDLRISRGDRGFILAEPECHLRTPVLPQVPGQSGAGAIPVNDGGKPELPRLR